MEHNEELLAEGCEYDVGINDGTSFTDVVFVGTKQRFGKPIMVFATKDKRQVTVNPSYHTWTIERKITEMNHVLSEQAKEAWNEQ